MSLMKSQVRLAEVEIIGITSTIHGHAVNSQRNQPAESSLYPWRNSFISLHRFALYQHRQ